MEQKILLVEDEPGLRLTLSDRLHKEGYKIDAASDGEAGFKLAASENFDLIILDLMLPKKNGFDVCRDLRQLGRVTPILMLTARDQVVHKVVGLKIGADDYVTKPFEMAELLARVEALLRRAARPVFEANAVYQFGSIRVDFPKTEVLRNGKVLALSAMEFQLLRFSIENRGVTLSRKKLLQESVGVGSTPFTRTWMFTLPGFGRRSRTIPSNRNGS